MEDLPGLRRVNYAKGTSAGASNWGCGFLPTIYAGVPFRGPGKCILYLSNPKGFDNDTQRKSLDALKQLNQLALADHHDSETLARIQSYEMAFQMQSSAPELMDFSKEPKHILEMYGQIRPNQISRVIVFWRGG